MRSRRGPRIGLNALAVPTSRVHDLSPRSPPDGSHGALTTIPSAFVPSIPVRSLVKGRLLCEGNVYCQRPAFKAGRFRLSPKFLVPPLTSGSLAAIAATIILATPAEAQIQKP